MNFKIIPNEVTFSPDSRERATQRIQIESGIEDAAYEYFERRADAATACEVLARPWKWDDTVYVIQVGRGPDYFVVRDLDSWSRSLASNLCYLLGQAIFEHCRDAIKDGITSGRSVDDMREDVR